MNYTFEECCKIVLGIEGGYSNDSRDSGGETKFGISKKSYPNLDIANLSLEMAQSIYKHDYWDRCRCEEMPDKLRLYVFDCAINQGCHAAIIYLQSLLQLKQDGIVGIITLNAIKKSKLEDLCENYLSLRKEKYKSLGDYKYFGKGWMNRIDELKRLTS